MGFLFHRVGAGLSPKSYFGKPRLDYRLKIGGTSLDARLGTTYRTWYYSTFCDGSSKSTWVSRRLMFCFLENNTWTTPCYSTRKKKRYDGCLNKKSTPVPTPNTLVVFSVDVFKVAIKRSVTEDGHAFFQVFGNEMLRAWSGRE